MKNYRLATHGDSLEMDCWLLFVENQFPAYETFWQRYVVPITNRPDNIHFKRDADLKEMGKGPHDVCVAQLHYTVLWHLHRAFVILSPGDAMTEPELTEGMVRLSSALDVAGELLERFTNPQSYDPWDQRSGKTAGYRWRGKRQKEMQEKIDPVEEVRHYRNYLVHGRIMPSIERDSHPAIGYESKYVDWRTVTLRENLESLDRTHFAPRKEILASAWEIVLTYLRDMWTQHLLARAGP